MKNLLVPTDFSPESHHAFELALQLATRVGGNVTLLHVIEMPETTGISTYGGPVSGSNGDMDEVFMLRLLQVTKQRMLKLVGEASRTAPGVPVHDVLETGRTGPAILQTIQNQQIDLVLVGAQGHSALEHFFMGSNTERLVRLAPCPVLAVKHQVADFEARRIVFPSNFSAEADRAAPGLRRLQALFPEAEFYLLQVTSEDEFDAKERIAAFAHRHRLTHVQPAVIDASSPSQGIADFTQQIEADLVVVPTHGRTGLSRYLQTSIAETVATHAFPPVLTFKLA